MLIDAHAHLDRYENSIEEILEEIADNKIFTISNSMDIDSFEFNRQIALKSDFVMPAFGIHPWNAHEFVDMLDDMKTLIDNSPIIGEIGLDYYFVEDKSQYPAQRIVFEYLLKAASQQNKIVSLHTKGAEIEVLDLLDKYKLSKAIVHWYSGPDDILDKMISRGYYFTIGVEVMFSDKIRNIAAKMPSDQLLTETDNPGGYKWLSGKPGKPAILNEVIKTIAEIRGNSTEDIVNMVKMNFERLIDNDSTIKNKYYRAVNMAK
jgi:TatD DNase family protein